MVHALPPKLKSSLSLKKKKKKKKIYSPYILKDEQYINKSMGQKNLATPAHFILSSKPMPRKKKYPRTNKESPNCQAVLPRTILSSASRDYGGEEWHATESILAEHPKKKDKYCGSAIGAWGRSNSGRNCHLHIKCPQLTFWPH